MSGTTIGNWGAFERDMFQGMSANGTLPGGRPADKVDRAGTIATKLAEVKEGHIHASTVKKFFLGLVTFGIYNICHSISAKNQRATTAALKEGVDNVHCALSYLASKSHEEFQRRGAGGNVHALANARPSLAPTCKADRDFLASANCKVIEGANDPDFGDKPFIRTKMGGVEVDKTTGSPPSA